jgi:putative oxidoreductase
MFGKTTKTLLRTEDSIVPTILRLALGTVMFAHGAQKALGWFGGYGYDATMGYLTGAVGLPGIVAFTVIAIEFVGAAALLVGAGGRLAALGIGSVMVGAVLTSHLGHGFFMNWAGAKGGEGFEYHILALALAAGVVIAGSGAYSVDRWLSRRLEEAASSAEHLAPSAA